MPKVGIVALSSVVPPVEFAAGESFLRAAGFDVVVHPDVLSTHWLHAGTDAARAQAMMVYAHDPSIDIIWCARGGYGAAKTLPLLDRLTSERGVPSKKLLVGYSDVTVTHEFVRQRWNWSTLHAVMPAAGNFTTLPQQDWHATLDAVNGSSTVKWPWGNRPLRWLTPPPSAAVEAPLVGGNLSLWQTLAGSAFAPLRQPHILFLEDLSEPYYRIDRMMTHLEQAGLLDTCAAVVLGDFTHCADETQTCAAASASPNDLASGSFPRQPLRPTYALDDLLREVFTAIGTRRNLPIAIGLPVGHGPHFAPLPLGARYSLGTDGVLSLKEWDWFTSTGKLA
ncbi:MAG TPA: LD-carboxypeptidase [Tepidisphaeraceae bacterium]|nr:LD-carboxypeptidase [Tepidisphaeraceae bacterium]